MRTVLSVALLALVVFLSGAGICVKPDSYFLPGIIGYPQETNTWCWAASGQMTMNSIDPGSVPEQCDAVNLRLGRTDCCAKKNDCPATEEVPPYAEYGFSFKKTSGNWDLFSEDRALSWSEIKTQIFCKKKPFAFSWWWTKSDYESGHMMVAVGYKEEEGEHFVYFFNPFPPDPSGKLIDIDEDTAKDKEIDLGTRMKNRLFVRTYDEYVEDNSHIYGQAFYDISN